MDRLVPGMGYFRETGEELNSIRLYKILFCIVCLSYLLISAKLSREFPPINTDEVVTSVHGYNFISGAGQRYSLYDDIFAPSVYEARDVFPDISKSIYNTWVGLWVKIFSRNYWASRFSAVTAGLLALFVIFNIGCCLKGAGFGLLLSLMVFLNPIFLTSACVVRPEIVLFAVTLLVIWLVVAVPSRFNWKTILIGGLCGLSISVHQNAVPAALGIFAFYFATAPQLRRWKIILQLLAGYLIGIFAAVSTVDIFKFYHGQAFYYELYKPPIFSIPWEPWRWIYDTFRSFWTSPTFYFQTDLVPGWQESILLLWIGMGLLILPVLVNVVADKRDVSRIPFAGAFLAGALAVFLGISILVQRKEILYLLVLLPFVIPLAGSGFIALNSRKNIFSTLVRYLAIICLVISFGKFLYFSSKYSERCVPYESYMSGIKEFSGGKDAKMAGPNIFWYSWNPDAFRDIGGLLYSKWYTGGRRDIKEWLAGWQPDYIALDDAFKKAFFGRNSHPDAVTAYMGPMLVFKGAVDTGPGANGKIDIYKINWDQNNQK